MNLNNNWMKYLDQQSGYFYYYNDTTNESKWEEMITTYDKISTGICDDNINGGNIKTSSVEYSILENTSMKKEKSTDLIDLMSEPEKEQLLREFDPLASKPISGHILPTKIHNDSNSSVVKAETHNTCDEWLCSICTIVTEGNHCHLCNEIRGAPGVHQFIHVNKYYGVIIGMEYRQGDNGIGYYRNNSLYTLNDELLNRKEKEELSLKVAMNLEQEDYDKQQEQIILDSEKSKHLVDQILAEERVKDKVNSDIHKVTPLICDNNIVPDLSHFKMKLSNFSLKKIKQVKNVLNC